MQTGCANQPTSREVGVLAAWAGVDESDQLTVVGDAGGDRAIYEVTVNGMTVEGAAVDGAVGKVAFNEALG